MKVRSIFVVIAVALSFGVVTCGGEDTTNGGNGTTTTALKGLAACEPVAGEAVICGTFYAPDGQTPVAGAEVKLVTASASVSANVLKSLRLDETGKLVQDDTKCVTDDAGGFACGGVTSSGEKTYRISGKGFSKDFTADVTVGETTNVPKSDTTAQAGVSTRKYAVVMGSFDSIEGILARILACGDLDENDVLLWGTECEQLELIDLFGINPNTALTTVLGLADGTYPTMMDFLKNAKTDEALALFNGVFFNCGLNEIYVEDNEVLEALKNYVNNGGNLYLSDWAYDYLERAWPGAITWYGDDTILDDAEQGNGNSAQPVKVADSGLLTWLRAEGLVGTNEMTFDVNFNLPGWAIMTDVGTVDGATPTQILTADSLDAGPAVSNIPITVTFPYGSGCVFYTSYHNEPSFEVDVSAAQTRVLEYLLVNRFGNCGN
jgi:hypothetical protein